MTASAPLQPVEALVSRAAAAFAAGDPAAARSLLSEAKDRAPNNPTVWAQLGYVERREGNTPAAVAAFERAAALAPQVAEYRNALGVVLRSFGRLDAALAAYSEAIRLAPNVASYRGNLGNLLMKLGRHAEACQAYSRAIELDPVSPAHQLNLAAALIDGREFDAAEAVLEKVTQTPETLGRYYLCLGNLRVARDRHEEAIAAFHASEAAGTRDAKLLHNLGTALSYLGRMDEAADAYRRALEIDPEFASSRRQLAAITQAADGNEEEAASKICAGIEAGASDRADAFFTLAKIYDDRGDYARAAEHLQAANQLMRTTIDYDSSMNTDMIDRIIRNFSRQYFASRRLVGNNTDRMIFVIGMPRSGTTLVEQILCSHPEVFGAGELLTLPEIAAETRTRLNSRLYYPETCNLFTPALVEECANLYLQHINTLNTTARYVTDKLPFNFRTLGFIQVLFPNARIIHCMRDPRDIALSCYFSRFRENLAFSFNLNELMRYIADYKRLMEHWDAVLDLNRLDVSYDELIADQVGQTRRMLEFCGLQWDDACLRFYEKQRPVMTASNWQVRQPMYSTSLNRWRNYEKMMQPYTRGLAHVG